MYRERKQKVYKIAISDSGSLSLTVRLIGPLARTVSRELSFLNSVDPRDVGKQKVAAIMGIIKYIFIHAGGGVEDLESVEALCRLLSRSPRGVLHLSCMNVQIASVDSTGNDFLVIDGG